MITSKRYISTDGNKDVVVHQLEKARCALMWLVLESI